MTDEAINRAVAERVMGGSVKPYGTGVIWRRSDGSIGDLPDYCTDPAAWGALFEELTRRGHTPSLDGYEYSGYTAEVWALKTDQPSSVNDPSPGRALALAALKAYGVEV